MKWGKDIKDKEIVKKREKRGKKLERILRDLCQKHEKREGEKEKDRNNERI